jgi:hypothetical protein
MVTFLIRLFGRVGFRVVFPSTTLDALENVKTLTSEGECEETHKGKIVVSALVSVVPHIEKI